MDDRLPAPRLRVEVRGTAVDPDALPEAPLPAVEPDPELRRSVERERYDEQILAALVFP